MSSPGSPGLAGLAELTAQLGRGEISARALTENCLAAAKKLQKSCNLFVNIAGEGALRLADEQDAVIRAGKGGALTGIPYAIKDIFCSRAMPTTCGSKMLHNYVSPYDATAHAKLLDAGGTLIGKTNMDEFAMGSSNEQSHYGPVSNPWDTRRVPGGSSGGSAVAVATGLVPFALGTDTGGSVRQPAAFCGVCGIKPTYGRVSRHGMVAYASSLDQAGVFARHAEDLAPVLAAICGKDEKDSTSADKSVPDWPARIAAGEDLTGITLGVVHEFTEGLDEDMRSILLSALDVLKERGAKVTEVRLSHISNATACIACYYTLALAEASSNLARYDGVRYGYRAENPKDLRDLYVRSRSEGFGDEVKRRILLGTYVLTAGYYDAYYRKAQQLRRLIREDFLRAFETVDLLVAPVTPRPAFLKQEKPDSVEMYLQDIYTVPANLAGLPAMSVPAGFADNLPVGMQLLAPHFEEERLLRVACAYQRETDWHKRLPQLAA